MAKVHYPVNPDCGPREQMKMACGRVATWGGWIRGSVVKREVTCKRCLAALAKEKGDKSDG